MWCMRHALEYLYPTSFQLFDWAINYIFVPVDMVDNLIVQVIYHGGSQNNTFHSWVRWWIMSNAGQIGIIVFLLHGFLSYCNNKGRY